MELYLLTSGANVVEVWRCQCHGGHQTAGSGTNADLGPYGLVRSCSMPWSTGLHPVSRILSATWLFRGKTRQYVFTVFSASVYQKPPRHYVVTESTPLYNPIGPIRKPKSREERLVHAYREEDFPITIVAALAHLRHRLPDRYEAGKYTLADRLVGGRADHRPRRWILQDGDAR